MQKSELLGWLQGENRQFDTFLDQIDPSLLDRPGVAGEFFDHYHDDHEPDLRAWLARHTGKSATAPETAP